ncbi:hypothetical protein [Vreelandella sulfidaeris]|uniref:Uncharacterized protein n=1 Tax=Vreelandella sulfidaeris TaxID=115553 RepID=A0A455UB02_9GAMM|nr:hypothetical protein HSBAA_30250 [Halomonas sulfidaeris]
MSQDRVYRVTLSGAVQARNPIEASHLFCQQVGKQGFDQFQVTDDQGRTNIVDLGLLFETGILRMEAPGVQGEDAIVGPDVVDVPEADTGSPA